MRLAFIVPRYGAEILDGPEHHSRLLAERLADTHQVEVLTTTAADSVAWTHGYAEGIDRLRGVAIRRFAVARTRDPKAFEQYSEWIFGSSHGRADEIEWLKQQGPWAPGLVEYLEHHHHQYDLLVFFSFAHAPTAMGIRVAPSKSVLIPAITDDTLLRLSVFRDVFTSAAAIAWQSDAERDLVAARFHLRTIAEDVIGCGVDLPEGEAIADASERQVAAPTNREPLPPHLAGAANTFRRRHRLYGPFILHLGRVDPGKGCEELVEYFHHYVKEGGESSLVVMGSKLMPLPDDPQVRFAGVLADADRLSALEAATVAVVPSPEDRLSLVALEAFAVGTPVLANARADAVVDHCRRSHAGLFYADRWEFAEALKLLVRDAGLRAAMGQNGKAYVNRHYRWTSVLAKFERLFSRLRAPGRDHAGPPAEGERDRPRPQAKGRAGDRGRRPGDRPRGNWRGGGDRSRDRGRENRPRR